MARVLAHIEKQGFFVVRDREPTPGGAAVAPPRSPASITAAGIRQRAPRWTCRSRTAVARVLDEALGGGVVKAPTLGGSVPMHLFDRLGLPVIGVPIVNYDNSQHSHNENLRVGHFWRGIETLRGAARGAPMVGPEHEIPRSIDSGPSGVAGRHIVRPRARRVRRRALRAGAARLRGARGHHRPDPRGHAAGRLTCRTLVEQYLRRIDAFDKNGPAINAIVLTNPDALKQADELDRRFAAGGPVRPAPLRADDRQGQLRDRRPAERERIAGARRVRLEQGCFQVARIKEAGAIVLAKSNMAEWAFTPYETVSSILPGYTKNPYALDRVTAGSSGGTAAAVAANFGAVGLGSDTGNSIRGPSSHQALVGHSLDDGADEPRRRDAAATCCADIAGPMARTVDDAVAVFQVVVGEDPADPVTAASPRRTCRRTTPRRWCATG